MARPIVLASMLWDAGRRGRRRTSRQNGSLVVTVLVIVFASLADFR
jgi:hypothetical protein